MTKIERTDLVRDALYTKVNTMYDECAKTTDLNAKQNVISDLDTIRSGASKGATALQSFTETDPTVPSHVKSITQANINSWNNKIQKVSTLPASQQTGVLYVIPE